MLIDKCAALEPKMSHILFVSLSCVLASLPFLFESLLFLSFPFLFKGVDSCGACLHTLFSLEEGRQLSFVKRARNETKGE